MAVGSVIVITSGKGGTGKTSLTGGVGASLALLGKQVLCLDGDVGLRNLDITLGMTDAALMDFSDVMAGRCDLSRAAVPHPTVSGLHLLTAPLTLPGDFPGEAGFQALLQQAREAYDYVLIDCPPSLSMLTLNALCAADGVIIPMQCEYYALEGLTDLVGSVKRVRAEKNKNLRIVALLRVMFDTRITLQQQVSTQLEEHFGDKVFKTIIPRNVRLAEAPSYGLPGVVYDRSSKGAKAYMACAEELIERMEKKHK